MQIARAQRPDLLLLDWNLPGRDGLEVCRALRADPDAHLRRVNVVMLTAHQESEDTAAGFAAGVTDYVTKPSSLRTFAPACTRGFCEAALQESRPSESDWFMERSGDLLPGRSVTPIRHPEERFRRSASRLTRPAIEAYLLILSVGIEAGGDGVSGSR